MPPINALGFVEVRGLALAIVAADAMLKSAQVRLIRQHQLDPGLISLVVEGDLAACRAAVDAGMAQANQGGEAVSRLEIGRPDEDTARLVLDLIERSRPPWALDAAGAKVKVWAKADAQAQLTPPPGAPAEEAPPPLEVLRQFIGESAKGRTLSEMLRHFAIGKPALRAALEEALAAGQLVKSGSRYRIPGK